MCRTSVRNALVDYGMSVEDADRWCDASEFESAGLGLPTDGNDWQLGREWIAEERNARKPGWA